MTGSTMRSIHIFPRFENSEKLDRIRERYDYLHTCIEAHLTLVFPFESDLSSDSILEEMRTVLKAFKAFNISTRGLEAVFDHGYYLFLNIDEGESVIRQLHDRLHQGILSEYQAEWTKNGAYMPHITLGRFKDKEQLLAAMELHKDFKEVYRTRVDKIYVEIIGENDVSIIEHVIEL